MQLHTVVTEGKPTRYFINSKRVSREQYQFADRYAFMYCTINSVGSSSIKRDGVRRIKHFKSVGVKPVNNGVDLFNYLVQHVA